MTLYRKEPIVVEAMQLTETNGAEIAEWCGGEHVQNPNGFDNVVHIHTREGTMTAFTGDYVIREPFPTDDRRYYPCKPEIFEATYQTMDKVPLTAPLGTVVFIMVLAFALGWHSQRAFDQFGWLYFAGLGVFSAFVLLTDRRVIARLRARGD